MNLVTVDWIPVTSIDRSSIVALRLGYRWVVDTSIDPKGYAPEAEARAAVERAVIRQEWYAVDAWGAGIGPCDTEKGIRAAVAAMYRMKDE